MAITATADLSNSRQQVLQAEYDLGLLKKYVYAQEPLVWSPPGAILGPGRHFSSAAFPFYFTLAPTNSTLSETADVTPTTMTDAAVTVTPAMYGRTIQQSEFLALTATPNTEMAALDLVIDDAARSQDYLARSAAIGGAVVAYGGDATSRATVSPAATADTPTNANFHGAIDFLAAAPKLEQGIGFGAGLVCVTRNAVIGDLLQSTAVLLSGEYGARPEVIFNGEFGAHLSGVRLIVSDNAKIFHGAGASGAAATGGLATGVVPGATSIDIKATMASGANGDYYCIGTVESAANGESSVVETVYIAAGAPASSQTLSIVGGGANGGFMYSHSSGTNTVTHAYQVYTMVFMGARALIKSYSTENGLGPNGRILAPKVVGSLEQFKSWGWKALVGYQIAAENRIYRLECASSHFTIGQ